VRAAAAVRAAALRKFALIESEVLATLRTVVRVRSAVRAAERPAERAEALTTEEVAGTCEEYALAEAETLPTAFVLGSRSPKGFF
jgi:hypothetical protein